MEQTLHFCHTWHPYILILAPCIRSYLTAYMFPGDLLPHGIRYWKQSPFYISQGCLLIVWSFASLVVGSWHWKHKRHKIESNVWWMLFVAGTGQESSFLTQRSVLHASDLSFPSRIRLKGDVKWDYGAGDVSPSPTSYSWVFGSALSVPWLLMTVPWTRSSSFSLKGLWLWWFSREVSAHLGRKMRQGARNTSQKLWRLFQKVQHAILKWWLMLALILEFQPLFHGRQRVSHI